MNELRSLLQAAVSETLASCPRAGISLSGGIDSSSVARLSGHTLPTFTGYYDWPGCDEREYAHLVKGEPHYDILITAQDFLENFDAMAQVAEPPFMGMGTFGQYMVAKRIAELDIVDHVLSGEGGDELFGGYARLMRVAERPLPDGYEQYQQPAGYPDDLQAALDYDWEKLPDLLAVDKQMLGAFGLESHAPMLDQRVIDYAFKQAPMDRVGKTLLKEAMSDLPPEILGRTDKRGFPIPLVYWAHEHAEVGDFIQERIGYLPDLAAPWDRKWWVDLCQVQCVS